MRKRRMNNLFRADGRMFALALDHPITLRAPELNDAGRVIREAVSGGTDGFLATYGVAKRFSDEMGNRGLILRADSGFSPLLEPPSPLEILYGSEDAARVGADALISMSFPGSPRDERTTVALGRLAGDCERLGIVLGAEALPYGFDRREDATMHSVENVTFAVRQAFELGADFVKTEFVGGERFREVVEACPVPVLVLGGSKLRDEEALFAEIRLAMDCGAAGVVMGRNVFRRPDIAAMCSAVTALVHEDATPAQALKLLA